MSITADALWPSPYNVMVTAAAVSSTLVIADHRANESSEFASSLLSIHDITPHDWIYAGSSTEGDDPDGVNCTSNTNCSCCSSYTPLQLILAAITFSATLAVVHNCIILYRFIAAWNHIVSARRFDMPDHTAAERTALYRSSMDSSNNTSSNHDSLQQFCLFVLEPWRQQLTHATHETLQSVALDSLCPQSVCPICMTEFGESEFVTACDEGCGTWFHKDCLFDWLDRSDTCPCCRHDLIHCSSGSKTGICNVNNHRGWLTDLTAFLGYSASTRTRAY